MKLLDPLRRRVCRQPTPAEVRQHRLTHLPFREWCPECVAGAANDHPHRTRPAEIREPLVVPEVHWDYCFPRDADGDQCAVVLVGRDTETRMTVAHVVPMKVADMEWVTEQAARDLLRFGKLGDVILKSDQEPAIVEVLKEISKLRCSRRTMIEASPVGDSNSTGVAERPVQSMEKAYQDSSSWRLKPESRKISPSVAPAVCMVGGVLRGLVQQVSGWIRRQDGPTTTEGEALESGDGGVRHSRVVQSVWKGSRVFDG